MNWRQSLKTAIHEVEEMYVKGVKAPLGAESTTLLHLLHTNLGESQNAVSTNSAHPPATAGPQAESQSVPWDAWFAAELNRVFQEHGQLKQPGQITAATIRHGAMATRRQSRGSP